MVDISVCVGSSCHLKGSHDIIEEFKRLISLHNAQSEINLLASFCTGNCTNGVCISINDEKIINMSADKVKNVFNEKVLPLIGTELSTD